MPRRTLFVTTVLGSLVAPLVLSAGTASAQYPPPGPQPSGWYAPAPEDHDGFFGRIYLGVTYLSSTYEDADLTISGTGAGLGVAAGWSITPELVLYGELFGTAVLGPELEIGGQTGTASDDVSFGLGGLGVGAAYYFNPSNFFVSGTLAFSSLSFDDNVDDDQDPRTTDLGAGVSLMAGKEWWVRRNTALGVAGQFFFGNQPEKDESGSWGTTAFGVVVTGTYN